MILTQKTIYSGGHGYQWRNNKSNSKGMSRQDFYNSCLKPLKDTAEQCNESIVTIRESINYPGMLTVKARFHPHQIGFDDTSCAVDTIAQEIFGTSLN